MFTFELSIWGKRDCTLRYYLLSKTELRIIEMREKFPAFNCTATTEIAAVLELLNHGLNL